MDDAAFAERTNALFRGIYLHAVRRIDDARERPSPETMALLMHLAQAGPLTLSEMALHLRRALSTLSAKVAALEAQGLLARQPDAADARRVLVWLSPAGRAALAEGLQVLDGTRLRAAAARLPAARRAAIVDALTDLQQALEHNDEPPL